MYKLPKSSVPNWKNSIIGNYNQKIPNSINCNCPFCNKLVNYSFRPRDYDQHNKVLLGFSNCPNCGDLVTFVIYKPDPANSEIGLFNESPCEIFIHPDIKHKRRPIEINFDIDKLNRAYLAAVESYNSGLWDPSVTMCRQVLEGIAKTKIKEDTSKMVLFDMLKKLPESIDLNKPIMDLADLIREGGNLGAHFDLEKEADETIASELLDMLEYLIEYIYQLPQKIEVLKNKINEVN